MRCRAPPAAPRPAHARPAVLQRSGELPALLIHRRVCQPGVPDLRRTLPIAHCGDSPRPGNQVRPAPCRRQHAIAPVSKPIRSAAGTLFAMTRASAPGSGATFPSKSTLLLSSTTHIEVSYCDTSKPTYCFIATSWLPDREKIGSHDHATNAIFGSSVHLVQAALVRELRIVDPRLLCGLHWVSLRSFLALVPSELVMAIAILSWRNQDVERQHVRPVVASHIGCTAAQPLSTAAGRSAQARARGHRHRDVTPVPMWPPGCQVASAKYLRSGCPGSHRRMPA